MTKKTNFKAVKAFMWQDSAYAEGETFKRPDDWEIDTEYTALLDVQRKNRAKNPGQTAFSYQVQEGYEKVNDGSGTKTVPVMQTKRVILPVV